MRVFACKKNSDCHRLMTEMPLEDIRLLIPKEAQNEKKPTCHSFVELFFTHT